MWLLLDTSTPVCRLSLVTNAQQTDYSWQADRDLARDLLAYIEARLKEHDCNFSDLTGLAAYKGPGSFTGLRIGLTVLNTLADSLNIPIVSATGDAWQSDCQQALAAGQNQKIVLPEYGGHANITRPKK